MGTYNHEENHIIFSNDMIHGITLWTRPNFTIGFSTVENHYRKNNLFEVICPALISHLFKPIFKPL
jgi:hypothetical protein